AGEYIAQQMYPGVDRENLSEEQRQTISALSTLAAGLAGGLAGNSSADTVAGAQAGKNAAENNNLLLPRPVLVPVPGLPLSPGDKVVWDANNKMASELDKALKDSGTEDDTPSITDGQSIVDGRDEAAKSRDPNVAKDLTDAGKAELGGTGSGTPGGWGPEDEENARSGEQKTTVDDLMSSSSKGQKTTGRSKLFERTGGSDAANKEFDSLTPTEIKDIPGGRVGKLPDGRTVIVRERSTDGRPTLEIQSGKSRMKFRYDE
ncbi:VENN motif pre-toxin domain-containing protein, partial [Ewingella sp. S1.OA.A_B6]